MASWESTNAELARRVSVRASHLASCLRHVGRSLRPVDSIGVVFIQVVNAVLQLVAAMALVNAEDKEADVGIQRELVHGIDAAHVIENKEQNRRPLGTRTVSLQRGQSKGPQRSMSGGRNSQRAT